MTDTLEIFGKEYTNVKGFKAKNNNTQTLAYIRPQGTKSIVANGMGIDVSEYASVDVAVDGGGGIDIPTFTVVWDNNFENVLSVSCDKTYAECANLAFNVSVYAEVVETIQGQTEEDYTSALFLVDGGNYLGYTVMFGIMPSYDIRYNSNGTFDITNPSTNYEILDVTENGTYYSESGVICEVNVNVPSSTPQTQVKSVAPSETPQTVTPDSGYLLSEVDVGAISSSYVGSGIARKSSSDLTVSGATVTAPAGYYAAQATKTVASGSATAPASISGTEATVSTGANTLTLTKTVSIMPTVSAGYVTSGTAGNSSVSLTADVTTQAAQTLHPSTSDQTIASGRYLTGAQTIKAVTLSNLTADNIKSGVTVKVGDSTDDDCVASVTGTYEGGGSAKNIQINSGADSVRTNGYSATDITLTVAKTGIYNVSWTAWRSSSSGTMGTNLHRNNSAGTNQQTWTNTYGQHITLTNQSYNAGDTLTLYANSGSSSRYCWVSNLIIEEV